MQNPSSKEIERKATRTSLVIDPAVGLQSFDSGKEEEHSYRRAMPVPEQSSILYMNLPNGRLVQLTSFDPGEKSIAKTFLKTVKRGKVLEAYRWPPKRHGPYADL